jgi:hypothetical protein
MPPCSAPGELTFDRVARTVVDASGLTIRDIARNAELDPDSPAAREVWGAFTELTEYRLYEDLRRGWRVVQPNLEQLGLLRVGYRGLEELSATTGTGGSISPWPGCRRPNVKSWCAYSSTSSAESSQ